MDIRALRYFVAVYEEGSITAASRRCFVAQPSISTMVAQLEDSVGAQLFLRHRKGVTATDAAEVLYPLAKRILGEVQAMRSLFQGTRQTQVLHLGLMPSLDAHRVGALLSAMIQPPGLELRLVGHEEHADARIVSDRLKRAEEVFHPLWQERYLVALPYGHPLTLKEKVGLDDLEGVALIERCHCELRDEVVALLAGRKSSLNIVARTHSEEWAAALVGAGVGAALLPEGSIRGRVDIVSRPLAEAELSRQVGLAHGKDSGLPQGIEEAIASWGAAGGNGAF